MSMTREEEINKAAVEYAEYWYNLKNLSERDYPTEATITIGEFTNGAKWADSHPVSQWRKAEEFPPEDPKHKGWSVKVIVINDGQHDIGFYDYKLKRWCVPGCINPYFTNITHWQTFPELPKEE